MANTAKREKTWKRNVTLVVIGIVILGYYVFGSLNTRLDSIRDVDVPKNNSYNKNIDLSKAKVEKAEDKPDFTLTAKAALLLDATSNHVLFEKNGDEELAMASTTKIMTCIVALEYGDLNSIVTFSKHAASMPDVQLNAKPGAKFTLWDLLHSLMLESHNDTAVAVAEHLGGSVEGFAKMMNKKAKELGLKHTHFVTPNGLDAEGHYTTAKELALLASYAIKNDKFVSLTTCPNWTLKEVSSKSTYNVQNKDRFLSLMPGALGVKTGFTNNAGYCFVGALNKDGKTLVSVVLGAGWPPHKTYKWKDTLHLMNYGLDHFSYRNVTEGQKEINDIQILKGKQNKISVAVRKDKKDVLMKNSDDIDIVYEIPETINAPVNKGEVIGKIIYYINGKLYEEIPVKSVNTVEKIDYKFCLDRITSLFVSGKAL